ncbi:MAG: HDOD domain-containing protein [bacterium]|nr:HDOD domain-containing protein [bacterium]
MSRILFVDDDQSILDGLRRMLRSHREEWEMVFAGSGREALEAAEASPFDVLVTDMKMPGMDGTELLKCFQSRFPETVRFVLSGHAELESVMRTVPVAHQFLTKPCDAEVLKDAVTRACELRSLLRNESAKQVVGTLDSLPSRPETYAAILEAIADPNAEMQPIVEILKSDVAMSAKLLQLVNSAFFGLPQRVADIGQATMFLGLNMLRDLVLSIEVFQPPPNATAAMEHFLADLQARSMWTGHIASRMFDDKQIGNQAFTAGMLHDIGLLVMATQLPEVLSEAIEKSCRIGQPLYVVEEELNGVSHAEIGAYLLGVWGLPYPILETAAYHHRPMDLPQRAFGELAAVHVASSLVDARIGAVGESPRGPINLAYLDSLGVRDQLEDWEALVDREMDFVGGA